MERPKESVLPPTIRNIAHRIFLLEETHQVEQQRIAALQWLEVWSAVRIRLHVYPSIAKS
jgi:hypothetical protein